VKRPVCGHCGKAYGQRWTEDTRLLVPVDEPIPPYRGNAQLLKESYLGVTPSKETIKKMQCEKAEFMRDYYQSQIDAAPDRPMQIIHRKTWDGETWCGGYDPFCTMRCALDFATKAYKIGVRVK